MNFDIPDPSNQLEKLNVLKNKYYFGKESNKISDVKNMKPIFAFDYLSFKRSDLCFNSKHIDRKKDYLKLLENLKKISDKTFDELSTDPDYHFHDVDFKETEVSESKFVKCLTSDTSKAEESNIPTVYQFKIFKEARIFGFFYIGVFYPVWLDRNHTVYKRK